jgi:hypothetical protein
VLHGLLEATNSVKFPDTGEGFLHSLLLDVKSMTAKQKRIFKIGVMKLMDEILDDTGSDGRLSTGLTETSAVYPTTSRLISLQEVEDNSQPLLTYWEMEYRKIGNVDSHLISMDYRN